MIPPFNKNNNPITILIPTHLFTASSLPLPFIILTLITTLSLFLSLSLSPIEVTAMKVHPIPKRRNISIQYHSRDPLSEAQALLHNHKKLRRLPHVFSRVLELPFRSDADVLIEENPECFRFVAETESVFGDDVRAHTVEIHPGVTKIVVRENGDAAELTLDELELDMWRFRLPETTRPELARAVFVDGELIVTVPKMEGVENENGGDFGGGMGNRLVLVQ